jgi:hypothetical protein
MAEANCLNLALGLVNEAIDKGELHLSDGTTASGVTFSLFSMVIGTQVGILNFPALSERLGIGSPGPALHQTVGTYLDGLGWKPLRSEWNYQFTLERIASEVFADEFARAGSP